MASIVRFYVIDLHILDQRSDELFSREAQVSSSSTELLAISASGHLCARFLAHIIRSGSSLILRGIQMPSIALVMLTVWIMVKVRSTLSFSLSLLPCQYPYTVVSGLSGLSR